MSLVGTVVVVGAGTVVVTGSVVVVVGVVVVDDVVVVANSPPGEQAMMTVARMKTEGTQRIIGTDPEARGPVPRGCCQLGLWRAVPGSRVTRWRPAVGALAFRVTSAPKVQPTESPRAAVQR